ncbi:FK506-binding protein 5 OS=Rhizopus delemar (strain RA 99-880 / ATCC MYA-4621 / FGSC 9543 / NRRL 43880) GN=FKBP5 PE=3 SV=1 [Rhizoctonia solani AG-1 IB]|uniref:FK506-binding protein 5 n=1 Tax=Thanatephorus cucumeris (strain AG1-IB / isolate 7/3/14) TaxID=1108050 RepID=A0A0B7F811_THACB|nr:FK506-binding protein 5 OS=Rhizopus delemar (strain RA 99-880 / ATCC MYA-4621 / FGSC 9543 / NRRL 43880) GN=FKBP5 PE=3 SV=1 [Rhizoctonia solani AG-1 IB]
MAPTAITHPESAVVSSKVTQVPQDRSTVVEQLTDVARHVMGQAIDLLENTLTDDKQLTYQSKYIPGKHLRHARDHYALLSKAVLDITSTGASNSQAPVTLSYDARIRDTPMETSITAGIQAFREAVQQLDDIAKYAPEDLPVVLTADTGPHQQTLNTTYGRELWFGSLHAIHHWSMVRVIAGELGLTLNANFGIAPSTINYHKDGSKSKI